MLTIKAIDLDGPLGAWIALLFARDCIHVWEEAYPGDKSPHNAIKATEKWLIAMTEEAAEEATLASEACYATVCELNPSNAITNSIYAAADSADAPLDVYHDNKAYHASEAARAASVALGEKDPKPYTHLMLSKHLSFIIDYKVKHRESFGNFEEVFESASDEDKEKLLFHLDLK